MHFEVLSPDGVEGPLPLLVLNDGQDSVAVGVKRCMEREVGQGRALPCLVVGVAAADRMTEYGTAFRADYQGRGAKAGAYSKFILLELLPWLEAKYTIHPSPAMRAIAGYSLGGLSAADIAWRHPEVFGKVGAFSGSFWWRRYTLWERIFGADAGRLMHLQVRKSWHKPDLKFWFQAGTRDEESDRNGNGIIDAIDDTLDLMLALSKKGYRPYYDHVYHEVPDGEHNPDTWREAMPHFIRWAFGRE